MIHRPMDQLKDGVEVRGRGRIGHVSIRKCSEVFNLLDFGTRGEA